MNALSKFQRIISSIFAPHIGKFLYIYIDDLIIFSKSEEEPDQRLKIVFDLLRKYNMKLKASKCFLKLPEVKILGFVVNIDGIRSDPANGEAF